MTALSFERSATDRMDSSGQAIPDKFGLPIAAGASGFQGGIACLNAAGLGVNASTALLLTVVGRWTASFNNTAGNSAIIVDVEQGVFKYANSAAGDLITPAAIGQKCFLVDDQTVALTSGGNTRSVAGIVMQVDTNGVWVQMGILFSALARLL